MSQVATMPCASFEDVFEAVENGVAAYGMLPMENSQARPGRAD